MAVRNMLRRLSIGDEQLLAVVRLENDDQIHLIPIVTSPTIADQLLRTPELPVSPQRIRRANRHGWNVHQHRQLIAIERPSTETEIVPVDILRYRFVGSDLL